MRYSAGNSIGHLIWYFIRYSDDIIEGILSDIAYRL